MAACCPTCGRKLPAPKTQATEPIPTSEMTDRELFAHYRKTAHIGDVAFMLNNARMSDPLRVKVAALLEAAPRLGRSETLRLHMRNLAEWRIEREAAETAERLREVAA